MAKLKDETESAHPEAAADATPSLKAQGVATVKGLSAVGQRLFPLRQKRDQGKKLTRREQQALARLEGEYGELEQALRELMRPRERDPWVHGRDHSHGSTN